MRKRMVSVPPSWTSTRLSRYLDMLADSEEAEGEVCSLLTRREGPTAVPLSQRLRIRMTDPYTLVSDVVIDTALRPLPDVGAMHRIDWDLPSLSMSVAGAITQNRDSSWVRSDAFRTRMAVLGASVEDSTVARLLDMVCSNLDDVPDWMDGNRRASVDARPSLAESLASFASRPSRASLASRSGISPSTRASLSGTPHMGTAQGMSLTSQVLGGSTRRHLIERFKGGTPEKVSDVGFRLIPGKTA